MPVERESIAADDGRSAGALIIIAIVVVLLVLGLAWTLSGGLGFPTGGAAVEGDAPPAADAPAS